VNGLSGHRQEIGDPSSCFGPPSARTTEADLLALSSQRVSMAGTLGSTNE
jgi:hypothetical protein